MILLLLNPSGTYDIKSIDHGINVTTVYESRIQIVLRKQILFKCIV